MGAAGPRPVPPLPSALSVEGRGGVPCAPHTLGAGQPEGGAKQRVCLLPLEGETHSCTCTRPSSRSGHRLCPHFHTRPTSPPLQLRPFGQLQGGAAGRLLDALRQGPTVGRSGPPGSLARGAGSAPSLGATTLSPHRGGHLSPPCSPPLPVSPTSSTESSRPSARALGKTQEPAVALGLAARAPGRTSGDGGGQGPAWSQQAGSSVGAEAGGSRSRPVPGSLTHGWRWLRR